MCVKFEIIMNNINGIQFNVSLLPVIELILALSFISLVQLLPIKIRNLCTVFICDAIVNSRAIRSLGTGCDREEMTKKISLVTTIKVDLLFQDLNFFSSISRAKFDEINMDLFNECLKSVESCLIDAKMGLRFSSSSRKSTTTITRIF
jgi:hypothetical protein